MLASLHVKNLALIKDIELEFGEGLNVLSGETGAGKSILLESILLCLGEKSDRALIRRGAEDAYVELVFTADDFNTVEKLRELDLSPEDGEYRFSRRLTEKKSVARINGETVTLSVMRSAASVLIDLYAQNEQQTLLEEERYIEILDEFGREALSESLRIYLDAYRLYRARQEEIRKLGSDDEERKRKLDFLDYEIREIEEASLSVGEEESLKKEYQRLSHEAILKEGLSKLDSLLTTDAGESVSRGILILKELVQYDEDLGALLSVLCDSESLIEDATKDLKSRLMAFEDREGQMAAVESRLDEIGRLKRKYGGSEEEVLRTLDRIRTEYGELESLDRNKEALLHALNEAKERLVKAARTLRLKRTELAREFSEKLTEALKTMNFLEVRFEVAVNETNRYTSKGADEVSFSISTNPGEPLKPLYKVASGGELSRIMLAVKTISSGKKTGERKTLVFDEVDSGISGKTAYLVGEKLSEISKKDQVLLISHLPQIVAMADRHFKIEKTASKGETVTTAVRLTEGESIYEVARLLGTGEVTDVNLQNAREMKEKHIKNGK